MKGTTLEESVASVCGGHTLPSNVNLKMDIQHNQDEKEKSK